MKKITVDMCPILNGYGAMVVFYFHKWSTVSRGITCTSMPFLQSDLHSQDICHHSLEEYPSNYDKSVL